MAIFVTKDIAQTQDDENNALVKSVVVTELTLVKKLGSINSFAGSFCSYDDDGYNWVHQINLELGKNKIQLCENIGCR